MIFITPSGRVSDSRSKAFPQAIAVSSVAQLAATSKVDNEVIWLDIDSLGKKRVFRDIDEAMTFGLPVVVMSMVPTEAEAFTVLKAGVAGYCHSRAAPEQLREIALVVKHKGIWMPPELMQRLLKLSLRVVPPETEMGSHLDKLTAREVTVAQEIAVGATNREISRRLKITERTVKAHLSAIFDKLGVRDRVQLALRMNNIETTNTAANSFTKQAVI